MEGVDLTRGGWLFFIPGYDARFSEELREELLDSALAAIDGTAPNRVRRSRHAETWMKRIGDASGPIAYFKVLDAMPRLSRLKLRFKGARAAHVASISEHLHADGIGVPDILLLGAERRGGRELIVTARVDGYNLPRHFRKSDTTLASRRDVLRALGAEISRFHRAGYVHGDLTPYNIFVTGLEPPQFVFIDHERTRRTILSRFKRAQLRNLVQLGHLNPANVTNTDRMRVWQGYASRIPAARGRAVLRRALAMLRTRIADDVSHGVGAHASEAPARSGVVVQRREVRNG